MGIERDNRKLTLWRGNPRTVAMNGTLKQLMTDERVAASVVETVPMVEYYLERSHEGDWNAVQAAAEHFDNVHRLRHGDYITCTDGKRHDWTMAVIHEKAYEQMKNMYGKNPPAFSVKGSDSLLCVQNLWIK